MRKKIYDVVPPHHKKKHHPVVKHSIPEEKPLKTHHPKPAKETKPKKARRFPVKEILLGCALLILLFGFYFGSKLAKASIELWPTTEVFTLQEKITANKSVGTVDLLRKIIPAENKEEEKEASQEFPATGMSSNQGSASGTIEVYNKISPSQPLTLKAGTHFLSDSGKFFITLEKIVVPGTKNNKAGSATAKVKAEGAGPDYNIDASKFSVPKLSGTSYYYSVWAESKGKMTGGYTGNVKKITADDISGARDVMTERLLQEAENSLRQKLSPDDIILEGATSKDVIGATADQKADSIGGSFTESVKVKFSALIFKKQDLEKLIKDDITSQLSEGKNFLEESLVIDYKPELVDPLSGTEKITVNVSTKTYHQIDINELVELLQGKSAKEIQNVVNQIYGSAISKTKINFWPLWINSAPRNQERIHIKLNF